MFKLRINGVQAIRLRLVSPYATTTTASSRSSNSMVEYLVSSLGFSKEEATLTSSKVSTSFKSTQNPNSVIQFLKSSGISQTQIKIIVSKAPRILSCNVDKTLKPKIQVFQEMGVSGLDLGHILSLSPEIYTRSVKDHIIPTLEVVKSLFGNDYDGGDYVNDILMAVVKKSSWLLGPTAKTELPAAIALLQSYGLSVDQIRSFGLRKTRYLLLGTRFLEPVLIRVEKLGIPRDSPMFFHGIIALCSLSEANLELRMGIYKSCGFTDVDVLTLARKNPYALMISESRLRTHLDFYLNVVGYKPAELAAMPFLLTLSLEKRVIPRYTVWKALKEKGSLKETEKSVQEEEEETTKKRPNKFNVALVSCLTRSEPKFFEKFVKPLKKQYPKLYSDYVKKVRSVQKAAK